MLGAELLMKGTLRKFERRPSTAAAAPAPRLDRRFWWFWHAAFGGVGLPKVLPRLNVRQSSLMEERRPSHFIFKARSLSDLQLLPALAGTQGESARPSALSATGPAKQKNYFSLPPLGAALGISLELWLCPQRPGIWPPLITTNELSMSDLPRTGGTGGTSTTPPPQPSPRPACAKGRSKKDSVFVAEEPCWEISAGLGCRDGMMETVCFFSRR